MPQPHPTGGRQQLTQPGAETDPDPKGSDREQDRFVIWGEAADWQFDLLADEDRRRRQSIAQRLAAALSPAAQLFGRDPPSGMR